MTSKWLIVLLFQFLFALGNAAAEDDRNVVLAGDSWARHMCYYRSFYAVLDAHDVQDVEIDCANTTRSGANASDWLGSEQDKKIREKLAASPIAVLYVSLGGNDYLFNWRKSFSRAEEAALIERIIQSVSKVLRTYRELSPKTRILLSGYDFANFVEFKDHYGYGDLYRRLGEPTPFEMNSAFLRFSTQMARVVDGEQVSYIHHLGLMHYYLGNRRVGLQPHQTLAPELISPGADPAAWGGDPRFENDVRAMLRIKPFVQDPFHLSPKSYERVAEHAFQAYLKDWLR